jgi:hypothetical protein
MGIHRFWHAILLLETMLLPGCVAIPLDRLPPASSSGSATCPAIQNVVNVIGGGLNPPAPGAGLSGPAFTFLVPGAAPPGRSRFGAPGAPGAQRVQTFDDFVGTSKTRLAQLPTTIRDHEVTDAILKVMVKTSAQAQIDRANLPAPGGGPIQGLAKQQAAVSAFPVPASLSQRQLKDFADKLADLQLRPAIVPPPAPGAPGATPDNAFSTYFIAYYEGSFYDRFGQNVTKPTLSMTIPDSEIASALTALVEYIVDLVDPTPVLGDQDPDANTQDLPTSTTYYPGGKGTKQPTALTSRLANYKNIKNNQCGVTTSNVDVLKDVANAAGDRAATISGLVSQSWGGISIGLGVLGKLSIGDNQTLGTIVKTAATRLAERISYAGSYWALDSLSGAAPAPAPGGVPLAPMAPRTRDYLRF